MLPVSLILSKLKMYVLFESPDLSPGGQLTCPPTGFKGTSLEIIVLSRGAAACRVVGGLIYRFIHLSLSCPALRCVYIIHKQFVMASKLSFLILWWF